MYISPDTANTGLTLCCASKMRQAVLASVLPLARFGRKLYGLLDTSRSLPGGLLPVTEPTPRPPSPLKNLGGDAVHLRRPSPRKPSAGEACEKAGQPTQLHSTGRADRRAPRAHSRTPVWLAARRSGAAQMAALPGMESLVPNVQAILLLDGDGRRIVAKYYRGARQWDSAAFEAKLFKKTKNAAVARGESDVILIDKSVAVFRCGPDARAYVVGSSDENELILNMVLDGLVDALTALLGGMFDARTCFENLETAMLCVDEVVDGGAILETDANAVANRVQMRGVEGGQPITDMTASQAISTITDQIFKTMNT